MSVFHHRIGGITASTSYGKSIDIPRCCQSVAYLQDPRSCIEETLMLHICNSHLHAARNTRQARPISLQASKSCSSVTSVRSVRSSPAKREGFNLLITFRNAAKYAFASWSTIFPSFKEAERKKQMHPIENWQQPFRFFSGLVLPSKQKSIEKKTQLSLYLTFTPSHSLGDRNGRVRRNQAMNKIIACSFHFSISRERQEAVDDVTEVSHHAEHHHPVGDLCSTV